MDIDTLNDDLETFYGSSDFVPVYMAPVLCGSKRNPNTTVAPCFRPKCHSGFCRGVGPRGYTYSWLIPKADSPEE